MRYIVKASNWDQALMDRFGNPDYVDYSDGTSDYGSIHDLSNDEVVSLIIRHGRAEISEHRGDMVLDFQNEYD